MAYKTVFTALTQPQDPARPLEYASELARTFDAHLDVMCLGVDRSHANYFEAGANAIILQEAIERARAQAQDIETHVREKLGDNDIRWANTRAVAAATDVGTPVARLARFSDIAIAPLPYAEGRSTQDVLLVESLLLHAGCPTLCLPEGAPTDTPRSIVIGWNESGEALRAVRAAMPFIQAANEIHITVVDPPNHGPDRSDPGGALAVMLSRYGVHADIQVMPKTGGRVGDTILRHVTDLDGDMIVMGGYGHSRFREAILGGATRHMLEHSNVPVLLAH